MESSEVSRDVRTFEERMSAGTHRKHTPDSQKAGDTVENMLELCVWLCLDWHERVRDLGLAWWKSVASRISV